MNDAQYGRIVSFIWGIADDVLRDLYVRGKYRDVILPMTVLRRLDAVLEPTKPAVLDMKTTLDLRPVHHRKEDRIRAHVQPCWLALLLIRIAENQTGDTWRSLRRELQRLHQGSFRGNAGLVDKTSEPTAAQLRIPRALGLEAPPTFPALALAA